MTLLLLLAACQTEDPTVCDTAGTCFEVEGGRYFAQAPEGWDGEAELPVVLHYHGYGGTGDGAMRSGVLQEMRARGYLIVTPDGINGSWAHVGSPSTARDELAFFDAVWADVQARWPLHPTLRLGTGFSQGGSMAWDIACYRGDQLTAFMPTSGAFWEPLPRTCDTPMTLMHTHGTSDTTVPMAGRPIGDSMQGDVLEGVGVLRATKGCPEAPDLVEAVGVTECQAWTSCAQGGELRLCLHDGGHTRPDGWLEQAFGWAEDQALQ
ncbi:MAG: hypothetical protein H6740_08020 [Alphaproteobacteria bacterium]|nr:hypothetical protein [Alphaproteobacteria bacterium]